jgi:hypothetical protein
MSRKIYFAGSIAGGRILKQISKGDNHYLKKQQPSSMEGGAVGHNFKRDTPKGPSMPSLAPFGQAVSEG